MHISQVLVLSVIDLQLYHISLCVVRFAPIWSIFTEQITEIRCFLVTHNYRFPSEVNCLSAQIVKLKQVSPQNVAVFFLTNCYVSSGKYIGLYRI